jgi:hypothetical protein
MIDPEKLEAQRRDVEAIQLEADRLEARNRLRAAELAAVRLGIRRECACGRVLGKRAKTDQCIWCRNAAYMSRTRLRVVKGGGQ